MYNYKFNQNSGSVNTPWRKYFARIKKVVVSKKVTAIGSYAFFDCSSLVSVSLPKTLKSIRTGAFGYCKSLTRVSIPYLKKVKTIELLR